MGSIGIGRSMVHLHVYTRNLLDAEASYQCSKDFASSLPFACGAPRPMKMGILCPPSRANTSGRVDAGAASPRHFQRSIKSAEEPGCFGEV
jgi:hypothetical protein